MIGLFLLSAIDLAHFVWNPLHALGLLLEFLASVIAYVTYPWRRLFWFSLYCYLTTCNRLFLLVIKLVSTPIQILTALQREKLLEVQIHEIQLHLLECIHKNRELEHKLDFYQKDRKRIKDLLKEADDAEAKSIEKIQFLEAQVQELESQNHTLKMQQENRIWKAAHETTIMENNQDGKMQQQGTMARQSITKLPAHKMDQSIPVNKRHLYRWRGAALASSVFSACLALLVGMIIWEAQDPCLPLVIALFIVVCISLKSVVQFFFSLDSRPGFDAVALLSFNWFVMGTLAFPILPNVAEFIEPTLTRVGGWFLRPFEWHPHG